MEQAFKVNIGTILCTGGGSATWALHCATCHHVLKQDNLDRAVAPSDKINVDPEGTSPPQVAGDGARPYGVPVVEAGRAFSLATADTEPLITCEKFGHSKSEVSNE